MVICSTCNFYKLIRPAAQLFKHVFLKDQIPLGTDHDIKAVLKLYQTSHDVATPHPDRDNLDTFNRSFCHLNVDTFNRSFCPPPATL
jgi:hypothetical protein